MAESLAASGPVGTHQCIAQDPVLPSVQHSSEAATELWVKCTPGLTQTTLHSSPERGNLPPLLPVVAPRERLGQKAKASPDGTTAPKCARDTNEFRWSLKNTHWNGHSSTIHCAGCQAM